MNKLSWYKGENSFVSKIGDVVFEIIPGADGFTLWENNIYNKQTSIKGVLQTKIAAKSFVKKLIKQKLLKLV